MSHIDCQKILNSSLGRDLTLDDCAVLSSIIQFKQLADEDILFNTGEKTDSLYVIVSGKINVTKDKILPDYMVLHTLQPGDMAGEMSFIDGNEHSLTLRAHGACELMTIQRDAFEKLLLTNPHVVYHVMRAITRSTHTTIKRMNEQFIELNRFINNEYMQAY